MIFISFVTLNTPYVDVLNKYLLPSLGQNNLEYDIEYAEDRGDWYANTQIKAEHIKKMLLKHKQKVCFLDADAKIVQYPQYIMDLDNKELDLAYHHFDWFGHWRNDWNNKSRIELLSGTMVWEYNDKVLTLIDKWIETMKNVNKRQWEQKTLQQIVASTNDLKIIDLPAEYCCVLMQDNSIPKYIKNPIIIHNQVSRQYKNGEWR